MKNSAIRWYEKEINSLFEKYEKKEISKREFITMKHNIFYKAEKMEESQIILAWMDGKENTSFGNNVFDDANAYFQNKYVE